MAAAGRAVRAWRADETQLAVAARAGINIDTLGDLEAGNKWPRNRTLRAVENALGRSPGELDKIAAAEGEVADRSPPPTLLDDRLGREDADIIRSLLRDMEPDRADAILAGLEERLRRRAAGTA
jgi:transcriptional regulator with XRE-family HTH domain